MQFLIPILHFIAFAFAASVIVIIPKALFFFKQRFAYEFILKHSLVAIIIGIAAAYGVYYYFYPQFEEVESEKLLAIPFYCMLAGIFIGSLLFYMKAKHGKEKS